MRINKQSTIEDLAIQYIEKHEVSPFMKEYNACVNEDEEIELIDKLISTGRTKLSSIEKSTETKVPDSELLLYEAIGKGTSQKYVDGEWVEVKQKHKMWWVEHKNLDFKFVIEPIDKCGILTVAEVNPAKQGRGLFKKMLKAIKSFAFEHKNLNYVMGRADIPRTSLFNKISPSKAIMRDVITADWRTRNKSLGGKQSILENTPTKLLDVWCRNKCVYPRAVVEWLSGEDEFIIVNEEIMKTLVRRQIREFEASYPKQKNQRYRK